jgi:hypothetical protein
MSQTCCSYTKPNGEFCRDRHYPKGDLYLSHDSTHQTPTQPSEQTAEQTLNRSITGLSATTKLLDRSQRCLPTNQASGDATPSQLGPDPGRYPGAPLPTPPNSPPQAGFVRDAVHQELAGRAGAAAVHSGVQRGRRRTDQIPLGSSDP